MLWLTRSPLFGRCAALRQVKRNAAHGGSRSDFGGSALANAGGNDESDDEAADDAEEDDDADAAAEAEAEAGEDETLTPEAGKDWIGAITVCRGQYPV